jgi:hypothetical protein
MKLPIQAQPVMRMVSTGGINASSGVSPSGDCGTGRWCCLGTSGHFCKDCTITDPFWGKCLSPQMADCAISGAIPGYGC